MEAAPSAIVIALLAAAQASAATPMLRASDMKPGIVVHINAYGSPSQEVVALRALGAARVRVDAPQPDYLTPGNGYDALCSAGIKITPFMNAWIDPSNDASPHAEFEGTRQLEQRHPGCIEAIEGPNEVNNFPERYHGFTGAAGAQAFQAALNARVKSDEVLRGKPVIGYTDIHPVDSPSDLANAHPYVGSWWQDLAIKQTAPLMPKNKGWAATEYGWSTPSHQTDRTVSEAVQAQRVVAGVAAMAAAGFNPAFVYELRDEGVSDDSEQHFGLFRTDWTPKPAATALMNFLSETRDSGNKAGAFQPKPLTVSISDPHVKSLLVAKSDGSYVIALWMNKHLGDPPTTFDLSLPSPHDVTAVDVDTGETKALGRKASIAELVLHDTDGVSLLRVAPN